jgi:hypothetical protein
MVVWGCWNLVLHQKLLHCEGGMTRRVVVVQYLIVSPFFWPVVLNGIAQMLQNFDIKSRIPCFTGTWLLYTKPSFFKKKKGSIHIM